MTDPIKIMFVCGRASGDLLAAELVTALKNQNADVSFSGIVGNACEAYGVKSLVPLEDIAVMGITEIIPSIFRIKKAINLAVEHIQEEKLICLVCGCICFYASCC